MRLLTVPAEAADVDVDWSFKTMVAAGGTFLVLCCSILTPHGPAPAKREFNPRSLAHRAAPRKLAGDFLVKGTAWAPGGRSATALRVAIELDGWRKELAVFGDRYWRSSASDAMFSDPEPFQSLPVAYDRAFGGAGEPRNPTGLGAGDRAPRLPNVERLSERLRRPGERDEPAGFGPLDPFWEQRRQRLGTFDEDWLARRWPGMPGDFEPRFWNEAPDDQQFPAGFRGDETLGFENLHPDHQRLALRLPGLRARAAAMMEEGTFRELPMALDTIDVDLDAGQSELVWRTAIRVASPRLRDVAFLFQSVESLAAPEDPVSYRARFEALRRATYPTEPERAAEAAEDEAARAAAAAQQAAAVDEIRKLEAEAKAKADLALRKAGRPGLDELARSSPAASVELGAMAAPAVAKLRETDPAQADAVQTAVDRAAALQAAATPWTVERVMQAHAARQDMAGADLSGLDLAGRVLDRARLRGAKLAGANLTGASLEHADLSETDMVAVAAQGASFSRANLVRAKLGRSQLADAHFTGAKLDEADFSAAIATQAVFTDVKGEAVDFSDATLDSASFFRAHLPGAVFTKARLAQARFDQAVLRAADFGEVAAQGACFEAADLTNMRAAAADFAGARFTHCNAPDLGMQQARLQAADFSRASIPRGNFAEADLSAALFDRAVLTSASFDDAALPAAAMTRANLVRASFQRANLAGTDFSGANLYAAGLYAALLEEARLDGCFLAGTLLAGQAT